MSWMLPAAKRGAVLAAKYGPQAKVAWDKGGKQATQAAATRARSRLDRRQAFTKAATLRDGGVLKQVSKGQTVWVVLSGRSPVESYPTCDEPLEELLATADLDQTVSNADHEASKVRERLRRARRKESSAGRTTGHPVTDTSDPAEPGRELPG